MRASGGGGDWETRQRGELQKDAHNAEQHQQAVADAVQSAEEDARAAQAKAAAFMSAAPTISLPSLPTPLPTGISDFDVDLAPSTDGSRARTANAPAAEPQPSSLAEAVAKVQDKVSDVVESVKRAVNDA